MGESTRNGWTPLHVAVRNNNFDLVQLLLEHVPKRSQGKGKEADDLLRRATLVEVNVNATTNELWTPLHVAVSLDESLTKQKIIQLLLSTDAGTSPFVTSDLRSKSPNKKRNDAVTHVCL